MGAFAREHHLPFPYLHDVSQGVARAYDAACTPDFYGFDAEPPPPVPRPPRRLAAATRSPATAASSSRRCARWPQTGEGPREPVQAIGCSIKWKAA